MTHAETRAMWAAVDWSQPSQVIAAALGVPVSTVQRRRSKGGHGPAASAKAALVFAAYVAAHRDELHGVTVAEAIHRAGVRLAPATATRVLRTAGVRKYKNAKGVATFPSKFPPVNWALPNSILVAVWSVDYDYLRQRRRRANAPAARWHARAAVANAADPDYLAAVKRERAKAAERRKGATSRPAG